MRSGRERGQVRDRKRRGRRKYGQARQKHARKGVLSCALAAPALLFFLLLILTAFLSKGQSPALIGSFGLMDVILAAVGLGAGLRGFRERDKNYLTCRLGIVVNSLILICFIAMFIRGIV